MQGGPLAGGGQATPDMPAAQLLSSLGGAAPRLPVPDVEDDALAAPRRDGAGQAPRGPGLLRWRGFGSASAAVLVPQARLSGPTPWVIAIMVTLTVIAAALGLCLRHVAAAAAQELTGGVTVQIVEAAPAARNAQAGAALARMRAMPDVAEARLVPQAEVDALIAPWLGADVAAARGSGQEADVVPVPALIDVRLDGEAGASRLAALREGLRQVAPAARVDAQSSWLAPVFGAIDALRWLALALVGLLAVALSAAVLLSARSALGAHRDTIDIVHNLGGTDAQIARIFERSIGIDAALGGAAGLAVAGAVTWVVGQRFAGLGAGMVAGGALVWSDWAVLALIPLAAVFLAMATARLSVLAALRRML